MQVRARILRAAAIGALLAAGLGGCSSIRDHRGYIVDQALLDSVTPGVDNRTSVERTLGRPTFVSEFGRKDWYYISQNTKQRAFTRPRTEDQLLVRGSIPMATRPRRWAASGPSSKICSATSARSARPAWAVRLPVAPVPTEARLKLAGSDIYPANDQFL